MLFRSINLKKQLKKATPTIRNSDGVVKKWEIEVIFTCDKTDGTTFSRTYPASEDVEYLNLKPEQFTPAQLISMMNPVTDQVFESHFITFTTPPTENRVSDFNLSTLGTVPVTTTGASGATGAV